MTKNQIITLLTLGILLLLLGICLAFEWSAIGLLSALLGNILITSSLIYYKEGSNNE